MSSVVNETNFRQEILEASSPVLVHFWTPWCGLCRLIKPMLQSIQGNSGKMIKVVAINADENFKLTNYYRLRNLPTIMLFQNGELIQRLDSFSNRDRLREALEEMMHNTLSAS